MQQRLPDNCSSSSDTASEMQHDIGTPVVIEELNWISQSSGHTVENEADFLSDIEKEIPSSISENENKNDDDSDVEEEYVNYNEIFSTQDSIKNNFPKFNTKGNDERPYGSNSKARTKNECLSIMYSLRLKHPHISDELFKDIALSFNQMLNEDFLPASNYLLKKAIQNRRDQQIHYFLYCDNCKSYLGEFMHQRNELFCKKCNKVVKQSLKTNNYFAYVNMPHVIQSTLQQLVHEVCLEQPSRDGFYRDVYDGSVFKNIYECMDGKAFGTYQYFIDSAPIFNNSKSSVWLLKLQLNSLPPLLRKKYILTIGAWYSRNDPDVTVFLRPFVDFAKELFENGIILRNNFEEKQVKLIPLLLKCDKAALPKVLNCTCHNGEFGCTFCLHPNKPIQGRNFNKYIMLETPPRLRLSDEWNRLAAIATPELRISGIKGTSIISELPLVKLPDHVVLEPLHLFFLGVGKYIWDKILLKNVGQPYYIGRPSLISRMDSLMVRIKLPLYPDSRLPDNISQRSHWKGSAWFYFILFESIIIMQHTPLPKQYILHWAYFVCGVFRVLQEVISPDQIVEANEYFTKFMWGVQVLYGEKYMTSNVHSLQHIAFCILRFGPMWSYSANPEESNIGKIKLKVTGHMGVVNQIIERTNNEISLFNLIQSEANSFEVRQFCLNLLNKKNYANDDIITMGRPKTSNGFTYFSKLRIKNIIYR